MEQKILSLKDDRINSEVELFEYPEELRGGRNLIPLSNVLRDAGVSLHNGIFTLTSIGTTTWKSIHFRKEIFDENTSYLLSFKIRKISGDIKYLAGHSAGIERNGRIYRDGVFVGNHWSLGETHEYPNDNQTYRYDIIFDKGTMVGASYLYIQPNRSSYIYDYVAEIWDVQIKKTSKFETYTPAPEDLNLSYPDFITEFKPSISDRYILTEELVEYPEEIKGGRNLVSTLSSNWEQGTIGDASGNSSGASNRIRVKGYIPCKHHTNYILYFNEGYGTAIYEYDKDFIYLGVQTNSFNNPRKILTGNNTVYMRMILFPLTGDISPADIINIRLKLEKGNKSTDWTPAPEDLGLSYSDHIQSFGTSFSNNILINEFIEQ